MGGKVTIRFCSQSGIKINTSNKSKVKNPEKRLAMSFLVSEPKIA